MKTLNLPLKSAFLQHLYGRSAFRNLVIMHLKKLLLVLSRIIEIFFLGVMVYGILNFKLLAYGIDQLKGQLSIVMHAKPVEQFMGDPAFPDSLKEKLLLIGKIRNYAIDSLGLKPGKNYTTLFDQQGKPLLMNLTAAEPFQLKAYTWDFPLLGTVSYKGFFNFEKGRREADALKKQNYDVEYSTVSAWSTLGWFRDPIFTGMLRRNEGQLAELIIHEMTHATIYLESSVDFNENLASAVGETGAEKFLAHQFGPESAQLINYLNEQEDYNRFATHMLAGTKVLDSLYKSFGSEARKKKLSRKKETIEKIVVALDTISFHNNRYRNRFQHEELPNNAYFLSFVRYDSQKDEMKDVLNTKFGGKISAYLEYMKATQKK